MSTPIPPNIKLEGLNLYAPRGARTPSAPSSQTSPSQTLPHVPECDPRAEEGMQASEAAAELFRAEGTPVDDAIGAAPSLRDQRPPISAPSLPPAPKLRFEDDLIKEPPSASKPPWLDHHLDETAPRRRFRLDPEIVPAPPNGMRSRIVAPIVIVLTAGCAAVIGLTMISSFQPDDHWPERTSERSPTVGPMFNKAESEPRLVVDVQKAFANEPLSLGVSVVNSTTGHESLLLAGLALGTRLSAGVPVSEASWQLAPRDLIYVYPPKDFIGIMNTAIDLLSANQRLIDSRAVRLEWIAKTDSSPRTKRIEPGAVHTPGVQAINPENAALMERGLDLLRSGDIASARLLFERLANAGIADAALALAATYSPRYLAQHNLIGVVGDETKARSWYQRASELGSTEADRILAGTDAN